MHSCTSYSPSVLMKALFALLVMLAPHAAQAQVPQKLDDLWGDFAEHDKTTPLESEVLKEWTQDEIVCRVIRYQVGIFKGTPSRVAAFYAFPKRGVRLPALLSMHGGGQSAGLDSVINDAKHGYASLSLNWGGNKLNFGRSAMSYDGPQTDWGKLDATHPPQRNKTNHFVGALTPDEYTLDSVESPRNSNWYLVLLAGRRALTFLEKQPEVDRTRIGVYGHSMGGKLTTDLAGIDKRVKAAVPSCGGSGDLDESQTEVPGGLKSKRSPMELACISDNAYIPRITCPVLWLSPTNDFHAHIDNMAWNWRNIPDSQLRLSISPHFNHHHADEHQITQRLWFDEHLKGGFKMPRTPELTLHLDTPDNVPVARVAPDASMPVQQVDIYYSIDPHGLTRFWRDAKAVKRGDRWEASCPLMSTAQPLFVFANVSYELPAAFKSSSSGGNEAGLRSFTISSRVLSLSPEKLQSSSVKATDKIDRLIDDGSRGWHDWYRLNWGHAPLWSVSTRKLKDAKWRGPHGAKLVFEIKTQTENSLVVTVQSNAWGAILPGKPAVEYSAVLSLPGSADWQTISIGLEDLTATDPKHTAPLAHWQTITELGISPSGATVKEGQKVKVNGKAWQGPREIRNLRWEGGEYTTTGAIDRALSPDELRKNFDNAIKKSLE